MKSLVSFIALIWLALADPTMISKNGYLDPGRITWWQEKWAPNPIELTQTNSGTSGVYVNVNFRTFTSVNSASNSGIVQLIVPSTFSSTITYATDPMTITGGVDMTASFALTTALPSAGVYGPFQVITRSISTGQIYDANYVFGCVAVSASVTISSSSLTTGAATLTSTTGIVGSKDALTFSFTVPSGTNLWKHDIFEIIPDSHWTITSPTCQSVDITSVTNYIKGPNNDNNLPCALAATGGANGGFNTATSTASPATNSIYIYGFSQEVINTAGYQVKLQVSSFTFPGSCMTSSSYSWTVKLWRWGTNNLLAGWTGSGPLTPAAGSITVSSWAPYNTNLAQTDLPASSSITLFTKLTFRVSHTVSTGGKVDITFSSASPSSAPWWQDIGDSSTATAAKAQCFLNNYMSGVSCTVSGNVATISVTGSTATLDSSKDISITLLSALTSGAKISTITSSDGSNTIDTFTTGQSWSFSSTSSSSYSALTQFSFVASAASTYYLSTAWAPTKQVGADTSKYLTWMVQPSTGWSSGYVFKVFLPVTTSGVSLTTTYIGSSAQYEDGVSASASSDITLANAPTSSTAPSVSSGSPATLSIPITATIAAASYFGFGFGDGTSKNTALPYVKSNVGTFYECWAKLYTGSSASSPTEFSSTVFSVYTSLSDIYLTAAPLCLDDFDGIPILVNYHANLMDFNFGDSTYKYMLDVAFSITPSPTNLGTGITDGNAIPIATTSSALTPTATITSNTVTISGTGTVTSTNSAVIFVPNGSASPTEVDATLTFYYVLASGDQTIKYQLYTGSSTSAVSGNTNTLAIATWTSPTSGFYTVGGTSVTTSGTATPGNALTITSGDYFGVGLPASFTASSPSITLGGISSTAYTVTSSSNSFAGGFIIGVASSTAASPIAASAGSLSYSFGGINAGMSSLSTSATFTTPNLLVFAATSSGAACNAAGDLVVKITSATITNDGCSLDKAFTNGADSVDGTLTLTFTTVNPIPGNGQIIITLATSTWTVSSSGVSTTCYGSGFSDYDTKNNVISACSVSGTTVTLSKFAQVAAGTVTVYINHIIPTTTSSTTTTASCFTDVSTLDANSYYVDTATGLTNSISLSVTSAAGNTNSGLVAKAFPNVPGATADIYLSFSLTKAIPAGSIISINAGFVSSLTLSSTNTQNNCWTDQYLSQCSVSGTTVSLTIQNSLSVGQTVQVYLDGALTIPSSNSTTSGWTISSTWNGVTITQDSTSASPATFPFVVGTAITNTFTTSTITQVNSMNAGESSSYLFSLVSSAQIATTDTIVIQFPKDFDPHVGDAQPFLNDCLPNNLYLTCSSSALGISSGTYCAADHWYVTVTGITKSASASATVDITVNMVRNPVAGTTSGKFSFYQYGSDGSLKSYSQSTQTITIEAVVANIITLKNVTVDSMELSTATNYNFNFYAANTYTPDFIISIIFPPEFNNQLRMGSTSSCKAVYYDESSSSTSVTTAVSFSSATSCTVTGNNVTLSFATASSLTVASSARINLQLTTFYNPQYGHSRSMGWDVSDYSTFTGTSKPVDWSNKFDIAVLQFSTGKTYAKSYGVLNSAYIGYTLSTIDVSVGDYNPDITSSGIKLLPGQQSSDIVISVLDSNSWPLKSKSLVLTPFSNKNYADSGNLKYTSAFYNYKAFQMGSQISFRVAATSTATTGVYYIDWDTPVEKAQDGSTTLYSAPLSILVEVCSSLSAIAISVDTLPTFYQYYTSIPIKVSLANAPATQLVVTPAASVTGISISPSSLTFGPDVTEKYFQVQVGSTYVASSSTTPTISYTLSGTDAAAFSAPKSQTATVSTSYPQTVAATPGITGTKVSGSEWKISVTSSIAGVLYWGLGCQGSPVLTFTGLYDMVSDLVNPSSTIQTLQEQLADEYAATETDIDTTQDADINAFFNRIHRNHCKDYWASSMVIPTSGATIDLNWLMAGTSYTFTAYIATRLTNDTTAYPIKTYNFTTDAMSSTYTTTVSFTGSVAETSNITIAQVLAKNMGINPSWLTVSGYSSARLLQSTTTSTFTYNVLSDSRYPAYTSQSMISNLNTNSAQAKSDFTSSLALTVSTIGTSTVVATGTTPSWTTAPAMTSVSDTSASFSATSSQAGTIYATCSNNDLTGRITYAWQVRDGLDATASVVAHNYAVDTAATSVNITISGLTAGTSYVCYFTACNNAPQNQLCIDYISSSSTALSSVSITTSGTSDSNAVYMGIGSLLAFLLILLN